MKYNYEIIIEFHTKNDDYDKTLKDFDVYFDVVSEYFPEFTDGETYERNHLIHEEGWISYNIQFRTETDKTIQQIADEISKSVCERLGKFVKIDFVFYDLNPVKFKNYKELENG